MAHEQFPDYPSLADAIEAAEKVTVRWGHDSVRHLSAGQVAAIVSSLRAPASERGLREEGIIDGLCMAQRLTESIQNPAVIRTELESLKTEKGRKFRHPNADKVKCGLRCTYEMHCHDYETCLAKPG